MRTFALTAVAGAATTLTGQMALVAVGALLVAALCAVSHWRDRSRDPGVTTEVALFLIYLVGVLSATEAWLAAAMAVTLLEPWALLQPGFWLSFAAVGLLMVSDLPAGWRGDADPGSAAPIGRVGVALRAALRTQWIASGQR